MAAAIPVIALSVRDDAEIRRVARKLGAQAFFRKPVDAAALLDAIDWVTRAEERASRADRRCSGVMLVAEGRDVMVAGVLLLDQEGDLY